MELTEIGELILGVTRDGTSVLGAEIRSSRPQAAQVLKGKTPAQAMRIFPLLFSVCGHAQGAAANAALYAAQHGELPEVAAAGRTVMCEAVQEHLWRVMLDWPKLLGLGQQEQMFARWYAMLHKIAVGEAGMAVFRQEFERDWLGMPVAEWRGIENYLALQAWWNKAESPAARLLAKLADLEHGRHGAGGSRMLPAWSAVEAQQACAGQWGTAFAAFPEWHGSAAETGAWSYYADCALLRDVWLKSSSKALTRLLARVRDVVEMASGSAAPRLDAASPAAGEGISVVRTARGLLMHRVHLVAGQVSDYVIVAPTEWNFHPNGAFVQDLLGIKECNRERLQQLVQAEALSLDPCVSYQIEIRDH